MVFLGTWVEGTMGTKAKAYNYIHVGETNKERDKVCAGP